MRHADTIFNFLHTDYGLVLMSYMYIFITTCFIYYYINKKQINIKFLCIFLSTTLLFIVMYKNIWIWGIILQMYLIVGKIFNKYDLKKANFLEIISWFYIILDSCSIMNFDMIRIIEKYILNLNTIEFDYKNWFLLFMLPSYIIITSIKCSKKMTCNSVTMKSFDFKDTVKITDLNGVGLKHLTEIDESARSKTEANEELHSVVGLDIKSGSADEK